MDITLADSYGFCEGVKYALKFVDKVNKNTYLLNNLVHNEVLMQKIKDKGVTILKNGTIKERIDSIKEGTIIFSAHGHDKKDEEYALKKGIKIVDATCPRVIKNMNDIKKAIDNDKTVIYIGIKNHEEAVASLSISDKIIFIDSKNPILPEKKLKHVDVFNQTTLNVDTLLNLHDKIVNKYEDVTLHNDICNATKDRQNAIKKVKDDIYYIIIIGDKASSNTRRLKEIAEELYKDKVTLLVSTLEEVKNYQFDTTKKVFLTAGASTPSFLIDDIKKYLEKL